MAESRTCARTRLVVLRLVALELGNDLKRIEPLPGDARYTTGHFYGADENEDVDWLDHD